MPISGKDPYNDQPSVSPWAPAICYRDQARTACHTRFKSTFMVYILGDSSRVAQVSALISFEWRKRIIGERGKRSLRVLKGSEPRTKDQSVHATQTTVHEERNLSWWLRVLPLQEELSSQPLVTDWKCIPYPAWFERDQLYVGLINLCLWSEC